MALTTLTQLSSPITISQNASLLANMAQIMVPTALNRQQLKALQVYSLIQELYALGGINYTTLGNSPLVSSGGIDSLAGGTAALLGGLGPAGIPSEVLATAHAAIDYNEAVNALSNNGKTAISTSVPTLLEVTKKLAKRPEDTLDRMIVCLRYQLSSLI